MIAIENNIIRLLEHVPGSSDKELANAIKGRGKSPQYINQKCRALAAQGILLRKPRQDGIIGNWLLDNYLYKSFDQFHPIENGDDVSEKKVKQILEAYLTARDWESKIAWGRNHGIDIEAKRGTERWIIEVKGSGDYNPVRTNHFLSILGEILQRMDDPQSKYSIALPDIDQFRRLWDRLPGLAKVRTGISVLFVNLNGNVIEKNA